MRNTTAYIAMFLAFLSLCAEPKTMARIQGLLTSLLTGGGLLETK